MARVSTKENKNIYQLTREALPEKCLLVVKPDSLAFHWAIQNGIHVMFDE